MQDPRKRHFEPYARQLADLLGLKDWMVQVSERAAMADSVATVTSTYGAKLGTIKLDESFLDLSPEEQRYTITHELVHLHLASMDGNIEDVLGDQRLYRAHVRQLEYAVDGIARAIAEFMPLPPIDENNA